MATKKISVMELYSEWDEEYINAKLYTDSYANNGRIFIGVLAWDTDCDGWTPWADLTVNMPRERLSNENCAFVDTNDFHGAMAFIDKYELGKPTGRIACSGWCFYPEVEFDMEKVNYYCTHFSERNEGRELNK